MSNKVKLALIFVVFFALGSMAAKRFDGSSASPVHTFPVLNSLPAPEPSKNPFVATEKTKSVELITPDPSRTLTLYDEVGDNAIALAKDITALGNKSKKPIYLLLNSPGGSVLAGSVLISAIESSKAPVITVCNGLCASMAAMIFEYGSQRYAADRSLIMFHPASIGGMDGELDKIVSRLSTLQRFIGKMEAFIAKRAGISYERYKALSGIELWIDGEDAVNSGFADKLVALSSAQDVSTSGSNVVRRRTRFGHVMNPPDFTMSTK